MDNLEAVNRPASVCPNCGAEYRAGFETCADCGVALVPPRAEQPERIERGTIEVVVRAGDDETPAVGVNVPEGDAGPLDLFYAEELPSRVVLARLDRYDAYDVAERLQRSGIGARMTGVDEDGFAAVVVHDTRLPDAQAILADMGFAPWDDADAEGDDAEGADDVDGGDDVDADDEADDPEATADHVGGERADDRAERAIDSDDAWADANRRLWAARSMTETGVEGDVDDGDLWDGADADDPDDSSIAETDAFVAITSETLSAAHGNAERLADAGIDVRILVDRYPGDASALADVCVPGGRVDEARRVLHIEL